MTFCTHSRWVLPESVRDLVIRHCLHEHGRKYMLHAIVVMPDHVHMVLTLRTDSAGHIYGLSEIMNGIKGASSHAINDIVAGTIGVGFKGLFDSFIPATFPKFIGQEVPAVGDGLIT